MASVSLDNIVRSYLLSQGRTTLHGYIRHLKSAIDIVRKISTQYAVMTETIPLRMDQKKAIQFPDECLIPLSVAWLNGDRFDMYQLDTSIALKHSYAADSVSATANSIF